MFLSSNLVIVFIVNLGLGIKLVEYIEVRFIWIHRGNSIYMFNLLLQGCAAEWGSTVNNLVESIVALGERSCDFYLLTIFWFEKIFCQNQISAIDWLD